MDWLQSHSQSSIQGREGKRRDPGNEIGTGSFGCLMTSPLADGVVHRLVVKKPLRVTQSADATATKEGRAAWVTTDMTKLWEL